jgi:hypothetical protein
MKLTNKSKELISLFYNSTQKNDNQTNKTKTILHHFDDLITQADIFASVHPFAIERIMNAPPLPQKLSINHVPLQIKNYILEKMTEYYLVSFSLFERNIKVYWVGKHFSKEYIKWIQIWLYIVLQSNVKTPCSQSLSIFIYATPYNKKLPNFDKKLGKHTHDTNNYLKEENVNTAFTYSCASSNEIIIYRKEEWFKVFIHESFHSFGLDFSEMENEKINTFILSLFDVESEVNLYEAYSEFWAEIINIMFISFFMNLNEQRKNPTKQTNYFLDFFSFFINAEINFSFFQMNKILNFINLNYNDLIKKDNTKIVYREKTNVLSYYIIKNILLFNYQDFFSLLKQNNSINIFTFYKTKENQQDLCKFIKKKYNSKDFLHEIKKQTHKKHIKHINAITTTRMSICEME